ncbi:MAG: hypothetical protein K0S47_1567 [Herbinix sp.]|jgi:uncharacterized protein YqhQ|nr:hypothetical protein [Herbinix sp.]
MKPSGIGGMAVIEGVMMKNKDEYAVAVRKPDNEIVVEKKAHASFSDKVKLFKLPIFRGMLAFVDSMLIGVKILSFSASFFEEEEETNPDKKNKSGVKKKDEKNSTKKDSDKNKKDATAKDKHGPVKEEQSTNTLMMAAAVFLSIMIAVTLFMILPFLASQLLVKVISSSLVLSLIEGVLRISIFVGYIMAISQMPDIKRVFMYHGAEHKTINCLENGFELTVENVKWQSKQHKRCGTSFMLIVMFISVIFFLFISVDNFILRIVIRLLLVPVIAGVSYEFIKLAGNSNSKIVHILSQPGMWMQSLTTKEPDDDMIEVAIRSVESVFDWRSFLETSAADDKTQKKLKSSENLASKAETSTQSNTGTKTTAASVKSKSADKSEEEDDEILKALDKYLDLNNKNN